ncbi:MAG: GTPase HflX, partial [Alphaproteobacteria bacterium]|nr:GTPase HflX [Alphaproteobacteria bacterium]
MYVSTQYKERDTAYLVQPIGKAASLQRSLENIIEEIEGLAQAIDLNVLKTEIVNCPKIHAGGYFGKGTREKIAQDITLLEPCVVIVNATLSPVQQRNLEKQWNAKIIDRTGLILEIFGERAQTKEGRLQVDLAALEYQRSRLVRSWTHLERQRGGAGFMGGPGERQIEIDRRLISQRITRLKKELSNVRRTRDLGRQSRARVPFPIISLVGYTNAGKSTLFNSITNANVFSEDLLFATLDPTMRKIHLTGKQEAILSDTVGFISDLPTHLIEAFRATLEHISYADVIVHVIDAAREDYAAQREDVIHILNDLGIKYEQDARIIEVYNKCDLLDENQLLDFKRLCKTSSIPCCLTSAYHNKGIEDLLDKVSSVTARHSIQQSYEIDIKDGKALAWLYAHGNVVARKDTENSIIMTVY